MKMMVFVIHIRYQIDNYSVTINSFGLVGAIHLLGFLPGG